MTEPRVKVGQRFTQLVVVAPAARSSDRKLMWLCRCDCGRETTVRERNLLDVRGRNTKSCGCLKLTAGQKNTKHGGAKSPEYRVWDSMIDRCTKPHHKSYRYYGGRGIKVCAQWRTFAGFIADMGPRPSPTHSIERRNNNGNYEPKNCYWATPTQQGRNKSNTRFVTISGERKPLPEWCDQYGIDREIVRRRLDTGWPPMQALTTPRGSRRSSSHTGR